MKRYHGDMIGGRYRRIRELGRGGMSTVYLVRDIHLQKLWAIKEIHLQTDSEREAALVHSLLAEADLMNHFDHPALPRIVDRIREGESLFLIMDYIPGDSLDVYLKKHGPVSAKVAAEWGRQLCSALIYLHEQDPPILYLDMKPSNIILTPDGRLKLIDFGIARAYREDCSASVSLIPGTRGYAPWEQFSGRADVRSDIYALGRTLHQLVTGEDPPVSNTYVPVRKWNPKAPVRLDSILGKCVRQDPDRRYQTCRELLHDLNHPADAFRSRRIWWRAVLLSAVIVAVFLLRAGVYAMRSRDYAALTTVAAATSFQEKLRNYQQAIALFPARTEAYLAILEACEEDGHFTRTDSDRFLALYNRNKSLFSLSDAGTAALHYKAGLMYFNYYTGENGTADFSDRIQKAYSFFSENEDPQTVSCGFPKENISHCYYTICYFYKTYILRASSVEEASGKDYENLIQTIRKALKEAEDTGSYDRVSLYHSIFMLLYDQRNGLAGKKIRQSAVLGLIDEIYEKTNALSVSKKQSLQLKNEITEHYASYRRSIEQAYLYEAGEGTN